MLTPWIVGIKPQRLALTRDPAYIHVHIGTATRNKVIPMSLGPWQLIIIAIVILVLFGRGKISEMMGDFGKGIKSFKQGMNEEDTVAKPDVEPSKRIEGPGHDAKPADTTVKNGERSDVTK